MIRTILFFSIYLPFTGLCIIVAIFISLFSTADRVHTVASLWGRVGLKLAGARIETEGAEHILRDRPAIYMANHQSNFDIQTFYASLPIQFRWLAKKELFEVPFFGLAMKRSGYIPVDRADRRKAVASMDDAADKIRQGASVIVFPEGTRSPDGNLLPFKKGGFMLALKSEAPIIPVAISGSRNLMPKHSLRICGCTVKVRFFPPIETSTLSTADRDQLIDTVFTSIASAVEGEGRPNES